MSFLPRFVIKIYYYYTIHKPKNKITFYFESNSCEFWCSLRAFWPPSNGQFDAVKLTHLLRPTWIAQKSWKNHKSCSFTYKEIRIPTTITSRGGSGNRLKIFKHLVLFDSCSWPSIIRVFHEMCKMCIMIFEGELNFES